MRVDSGGRPELGRVLTRQDARCLTLSKVRPGQHEPHHTGVSGSLDDLQAVSVEAAVGEIEADVDHEAVVTLDARFREVTIWGPRFLDVRIRRRDEGHQLSGRRNVGDESSTVRSADRA